MNEEQIKQIVEKAIDDRFCCNFSECEAGYCRARLVIIEEKIDHLIEGTSGSLNSIIDFLKRSKRHD